MSIETIAKKIVTKHHSPEKATELVAAEIRKDKKLLAAITDSAVKSRAQSLVYAARHNVRESIKASTFKGIDRDAMRVGTASMRDSVLDSWSLSSGIALGDAKRNDLTAESAREKEIADGHLANVSFYDALADRCKDDKKLRECCKADEVLRIMEVVNGKKKAG